jgi:hypothetical protein
MSDRIFYKGLQRNGGDDPKNTCAVHSDHIGFSGDIRDFEDGRQGIDGAASESDRSVVHPDTARISALRVPAHGDNGADDWLVRGLLYTCGFLFPELPKQKVAGFRYKSKYIKESRRQSCFVLPPGFDMEFMGKFPGRRAVY